MNIKNIIKFGNKSNSDNCDVGVSDGNITSPKKIYECCDYCGIVTSEFENILKLECMCCDEKIKKIKV